MFKIKFLAVILFISTLSFAQTTKVEKDKVFKIDSIRSKIDFSKTEPFEITKVFVPQKLSSKYFIPNAKPKNDSLYAALKGKKRDDSIYNMPNCIQKKNELAKK